jgi:hypothetical protein
MPNSQNAGILCKFDQKIGGLQVVDEQFSSSGRLTVSAAATEFVIWR